VDTTMASELIPVGPIGLRLQESQIGGNFTMFEYVIPVDARVPISAQPRGFR
jgi:hypothetical protein